MLTCITLTFNQTHYTTFALSLGLCIHKNRLRNRKIACFVHKIIVLWEHEFTGVNYMLIV